MSARSADRRLVPLSDVRRAVGLCWHVARWPLFALVAMALSGALAPIVVAWLTKSVLDGVVAGAAAGPLLGLATAIAAVGALSAVVPRLEEYLRAELGRRSSLLAKDRLYRAVDRLVGLRRFEDAQFRDRLHLADRGTRASAGVVCAWLAAGRAVLTMGGYVGSLAVISPGITAVVAAAAVPTLFAELALSRRRSAMMWQIGPAERLELFYSQLLTSVHAAKEIRLFGTGSFLRARMRAQRRTADAAHRRMDGRELRTQTVLALLSSTVAGAGLVWAIHAVAQGRLSVGDIAMFIAAVAGVQSALGTVIAQLATGHQQLAEIGHYTAILDAGPDLPVPDDPRPVPALREGIELRDVWFRYSDDHPWVLRGVSMHIEPGQAVGLVGSNGAGKSTLVKLLCRFYDPTRGAIYWDGVDLRALDPWVLRERISAVFQDYMEYDLTAAENIGLGALTAVNDRTRVTEAARRAGIHHMLSQLPDGYDTLLSQSFAGDGASQAPFVLSGGQWQRLALARALMRDTSDLMILDEPSAGLDAEAERQVQTQLRRHRAGRTSLLISHRLATIRDADQIAVLDGGTVVEQGRHAELMALNGRYARLFTMQAAGYGHLAAELGSR